MLWRNAEAEFKKKYYLPLESYFERVESKVVKTKTVKDNVKLKREQHC